ncbi:hypothetical protein PFISCL1PPCAC_16361, partial [Pristionchus fissidentatus]
QMGLKYKKLSREAKRDLERFFCMKNVIGWLMGEMRDKESPGGLFQEMVGLNVHRLKKVTQSGISTGDLKKELKSEAEQYGITTQEYIDTCADIISEMSEIELEEEWSLSRSRPLNETEEWKSEIPSEILREPPARFYGFFSNQREVFVSRFAQLTEQPRKFVELTDSVWIDYIIDSIEGDKNAAIVTAGRKVSKALKSLSEESKFELERVLCVSRTISHFTGRHETIVSFFHRISKEE